MRVEEETRREQLGRWHDEAAHLDEAPHLDEAADTAYDLPVDSV